jgi:hypothetical protein
MDISRRGLLQLACVALPWTTATPAARSHPEQNSDSEKELSMVRDTFPAQPMELVREMVTVSHFDLKRVKELTAARPSLVNAAWDWGFGDWETPLGAASHMGNRPIAEYLLSQGAPPTLFSAAMLGQADAVKALLMAAPGAERIRGPHSISLLAHARMGAEPARDLFEFLKSLERADLDAPVPLKDEDAAGLVGTYVFGVGVTQQVEVTSDVGMYGRGGMYTHGPQLNWTRQGTMTRPLFHLGNRVFYPAGAPLVRVEFRQESESVRMQVRDGEMAFSAARKPESKR